MKKIKTLLILFVALLISCVTLVGCESGNTDKHTHTLSFVAEVPATESATGIKGHYVCSDCNDTFLDIEGEQKVVAEDLIINKLPHSHRLSFVAEAPATESATGIKEHYVCSGCSDIFLDAEGKQKTSLEDLVLRYIVNDETLSLKYVFSGDESERESYAEGRITLNSTIKFSNGDKLDFYWGRNKTVLENYYPIFTKKISSSNVDTIDFDIAENVCIPQQAKQIIVLKNGEYASSFDIDSSKVSNEAFINKYAVLSDVHQNYVQGKDHLLNVLNQLESLDVKYIINSGDIGKETANYETYAEVCKQSNYTGLIFSSTGNHDQEKVSNRRRFKECAVYDGANKTFINLNDINSYFDKDGGYKGNLKVKAYYQDIEGEGSTLYYYIEIENNMYFFMDQMIDIGSSTPEQDNFSVKQLNYLESVLYETSKTTKNMFIVEHAPIEQYKVGDKFTPKYGAQLKVSNAYTNNKRFANMLKEYNEAIVLTGHTHVQYDVAINFIDKVYDEQEVLTDIPLARTFHVSSTSQPRWYEGEKIIMSNKVGREAASEGYIVYESENNVIFEGNSFKEMGDKPYERNVFSKYSYIIPTMSNTHTEPTPVQESDSHRGKIFYNGKSVKLANTYSRGLSFEYKITTNEQIRVKFYGANSDGSMNWDKYYGDFELTNVGKSYDGVTFTLLPDGYAKIEMNFAKIKRVPHGAPANVGYIYFEQINQTNADGIKINTVYDGYIDNVSAYTPEDSGSDLSSRGNPFEANKDLTIKNLTVNTKFSFEYRIDNAGKMSIAIMHGDWQKYYGYYEFDENGATSTYSGITTQKLSDGYVKVDMDLSKLNRTCNNNDRNNAPNTVNIFYVRGVWTTASGYVDKIIYS